MGEAKRTGKRETRNAKKQRDSWVCDKDTHTVQKGHTQCDKDTHTVQQGLRLCDEETHSATWPHTVLQGLTLCDTETHSATWPHTVLQGHTHSAIWSHSCDTYTQWRSLLEQQRLKGLIDPAWLLLVGSATLRR